MGFIEPSALPEVQPKAGWHGRFFHSEHMTFAYYTIDAGAVLPPHAHANEEVWHVIDGSIELSLGNETRAVAAGSALVVPPNALHGAYAHERCVAIVVDHPVRREVAGRPI
jgi:quercetin dioxygenase-like cupin family protein